MGDIIERYKILLMKKEDAKILVETTKSKIKDKQKSMGSLKVRMQEKYKTSDYESLQKKKDEYVKNLTYMVKSAEEALNEVVN